MTTLIIEDDALIRLSHEVYIQDLGFEYASFVDAETALEAYRQTFYPLIVTDMGLPDMDGLELCRRIRALPNGDQSIILMISGTDTAQDFRSAAAAGVDGFLSKPASKAQIHEYILALIERTRMMPEKDIHDE